MNNSTLIDRSIIKSLYPLNLIDDVYLDQLLAQVTIEFPSLGSVILKESMANNEFYHYLLEGAIEHRISFDRRITIDCSNPHCANPLEELLKEGGVIKALAHCGIIRFSTDTVSQLMSLGQSQEFKVVYVSEGEQDLAAETLIDDNFKADWTETFLQSPLVSNIAAVTMMQLFAQLESIDVKAGEQIIKANTTGDYFYVIKEGVAQVFTDNNGPFAGAVFDLSAGDYFGDEALVADTIRNASVVMKADGVLGRLDKAAFNSLIKNSLMKTLSSDDLKAIEVGALCYLDVRLAAEYRHGHQPGAKNYPIAYVRRYLDSFDRNQIYIVTTECRRRSELAVYLMRQAGYEVYLAPASHDLKLA